MYNKKAKQFENDLTALINNSGINISTAYYIIKDLLNELEQAYKAIVEKEQEEKGE